MRLFLPYLITLTALASQVRSEENTNDIEATASKENDFFNRIVDFIDSSKNLVTNKQNLSSASLVGELEGLSELGSAADFSENDTESANASNDNGEGAQEEDETEVEEEGVQAEEAQAEQLGGEDPGETPTGEEGAEAAEVAEGEEGEEAAEAAEAAETTDATESPETVEATEAPGGGDNVETAEAPESSESDHESEGNGAEEQVATDVAQDASEVQDEAEKTDNSTEGEQSQTASNSDKDAPEVAESQDATEESQDESNAITEATTEADGNVNDLANEDGSDSVSEGDENVDLSEMTGTIQNFGKKKSTSKTNSNSQKGIHAGIYFNIDKDEDTEQDDKCKGFWFWPFSTNATVPENRERVQIASNILLSPAHNDTHSLFKIAQQEDKVLEPSEAFEQQSVDLEKEMQAARSRSFNKKKVVKKIRMRKPSHGRNASSSSATVFSENSVGSNSNAITFWLALSLLVSIF